MYAIGRGCFGKVWKARHKSTNSIMAIKQMSKTKIIDQNSERLVMQERLFLSNLRNQFIVNMIFSFQDSNYLYLGLELMKGGDLRYHLINYPRTFNESQLKFLLSNIIMGIEYIHSKNIIHRDLKPENILFDNKGYAYITDFNISCKKEEINTNNDISGTPVYMAPESIFLREQNFSIDFYSLGIISYELIMGRRPYEGNNRQEIKNILNDNNFEIKDNIRISSSCQDLINRLLDKNPENRIGFNSGTIEIKKHFFFNGFNWDLLQRRKFVSPIAEIINFEKSKNNITDELFDQNYCNRIDEIDENTNNRYNEIMNHENYRNYFRQYTYLCKDAISEILNKKMENGGNYTKKSFKSNRSMNNSYLPGLKTKSHKSISVSHSEKYYHGGHHQSYHHKQSFPKKKNYRYQSNNSNKSVIIDYYEKKLDKYRNLLRQKEKMEDDYNINVNYYPKYDSLFKHHGRNYMYGNDMDFYSDPYNGLERRIYKDVFDGLHKDNKRYYIRKRRKEREPPNQYQINNYFPPPYMMGMGMGMGMGMNMGMFNPYNMMNPMPNKSNNDNELILPDIYIKSTHKHHHHKSKSSYYRSKYTKSSYINSSHKYHKSSKRRSDKSESTRTKKSKKSSKKKDEESSDVKSKKSKKKKKSSKKDDESENEENEDNEENEENEEEEDEEENEKDNKKKKKKKKDDEDEENEEDEDNEGEENEDEEGEDDEDKGKKKKKKKKGGDEEENEDEENEDEDNEGEEKEDGEDGGEEDEGGEENEK